MKTCPSCCADDLPDAATHCKHCGRRIKPVHLARNIILLLLLLLLCYVIYAGAIAPALAHADARDQARALVEDPKFWCNPDTPESIAEARSEEIEAKIDKLDLDGSEKSNFRALFENQLELLGCGFNARNRPKPRKQRH
jgi:hypothetical protein